MLARLLRKPGRMGPVTGLSSRLLVMTVFFVMLVEVFVYAPSVARFRVDWLEQRVSAAQLTVIALEATPDASVTVELANRLLDQVGRTRSSCRRPPPACAAASSATCRRRWTCRSTCATPASSR